MDTIKDLTNIKLGVTRQDGGSCGYDFQVYTLKQ